LAAETAEGALVHFLQPTTWAEALQALALPIGLPVAGGADVMADLDFHRRRNRRCTGYQKLISAVYLAARRANGAVVSPT
jgi:hypothetical protein